MFTFLDSIQFQFSIVGLTETWLKSDSHLNLYNLPGYELITNNRPDKRGGGVGMFIQSDIKFKLRKDLICTHRALETLFIEINVRTCNNNSVKCIVGICYRPPGYNMSQSLEM